MAVLTLLVSMPYETYTPINLKTNKILDCHVARVALAGNVVKLEMRGLTIL